MKKILVLIIIFSLMNSLVSLATPTSTSFLISPSNNNTINVSNSNSTNIRVVVGFSTPLRTNGTIEYASVSAQVVYFANGIEETLGTVFTFSDADFQRWGGRLTNSYDVTIPAGKAGGQIKLKYFYKCDHTGGIQSQATYSPIIYTTTLGVLPPPATFTEGAFIKNDATGEVFVGLGGTYRRIVSLANATNLTDYVLFKKSTADVAMYHTNSNSTFSPIGADIGVKRIARNDWGMISLGEGAALVRDTDGKVYLFEKEYNSSSIRWIVDMNAFNFYKFDETKINGVDNQFLFPGGGSLPYENQGPNITAP
ncbi:hypothetical protein [Niabella beijingensis]|uniref:hypothetical protein n=1 Tax=Niabella beijingensis TaxID=2872700 RepID=UPI001CBA8450|nr:hypothetical protein [Niabella beijingensis]MBZ4189659.1 hypothetical protein [Niabella beijingensis]